MRVAPLHGAKSRKMGAREMARLRGTSGDDLLKGSGANDEINGLDGNDVIYGYGGRDALTGDGGDDWVYGGDGNDHVLGGPGVDRLYGENGDDTLFSGLGADHLWGGLGRDVFDYRNGTRESSSTLDANGIAYGVDTIYDFQSGIDKIDLSRIDANTTTPVTHRAGNEAFTFVGLEAFTNRPGELRYEVVDGNTYIHGDVDGDGIADITIKLLGAIQVSEFDFFL